MAGTTYGYADNKLWKQHPQLVGPCILQVQYGGECLIHFGALPNPLTPEVYEGVMHQHLGQGDMFRYTGAEEIWIRTSNDDGTGITQRAKIVASPLVNV